ncbi:hypothetical protein ACG02S_11020 [Roseateles sp. DC23W]|uniref:Uncharacterized protein n=1 Tax=Pelomonas dachongensis TaxID=3299029 RepID=A0ABW7ELW7_9BURK
MKTVWLAALLAASGPVCAQDLASAAPDVTAPSSPQPAPVTPATREGLLLTVWDESSLDAVRAFGRLMGSQALRGDPVVERVAPGIVALVAVGPLLRPVGRDEIEPLGLSSAQALALARTQLRAALPPLDQVARPVAADVIGRLQGPAESSRVLLHADWASLAQGQQGQLLVAPASPDMLLWSADTSAAGRQALRRAKREALESGDRRASLPTRTLLRWTPLGWEPVH